MDYERIPFRCQRCHAMRQLARNCHLGFPQTFTLKRWISKEEAAQEQGRTTTGKYEECHIQEAADMGQPLNSREEQATTNLETRQGPPI